VGVFHLVRELRGEIREEAARNENFELEVDGEGGDEMFG